MGGCAYLELFLVDASGGHELGLVLGGGVGVLLGGWVGGWVGE